MTLPIRLILSVVAMLLLASCSEMKASSSLKAELEVFRVFPIFDSEGSRRIARSELGCDPCKEVVDEKRDGNHARYFLNPDAGVLLTSSMIEDAGVEMSGEGAVVFVVLSASGKAMIESLIAAHDDLAANFVNGDLIGLVPLKMIGTHYLIAFAPTRTGAEEIVQLLR